MNRTVAFVVQVVALMVLWLLAWGEITPVKVVSGLVLATVILAAFPSGATDPQRVRLSPVGLVRLSAYVAWQLVSSNVLVAREIVTPGTKVHTGVLAHDLDGVPDAAMSLIANIIALTPGTMTVELTRRPRVIFVHFLLLDDEDAARASIERLRVLVTAALYRGGTTGEAR